MKSNSGNHGTSVINNPARANIRILPVSSLHFPDGSDKLETAQLSISKRWLNKLRSSQTMAFSVAVKTVL